MSDGNKESLKELLSTFRTLFAILISGLFFSVTFAAKVQMMEFSRNIFWLGIFLGVFSIFSMIYLFFLAIPKLLKEEEDIIEKLDIKILSSIALGAFFSSYLCLALSFYSF